jgi:hypothetical protein
VAAAEEADRSREYINYSQRLECGNWETEQYNYVLEIMRPRSFIVFFFWKYIFLNQTFISDSHLSFICCEAGVEHIPRTALTTYLPSSQERHCTHHFSPASVGRNNITPPPPPTSPLPLSLFSGTACQIK